MTIERDLLRRKALLAAGSVVLAFGLEGCPGTSTGDTDTASADTASADAADSAETAADDRPVCTGLSATDVTACCESLSAWCEDAYPEVEAQNECTFGPGFGGSTGCIPWGPPAPPRLRAVA